jgi:hypothetical protein
VDNIKMNLREIGWSGVDCTDLVQDGTCKYGKEPSGSMKVGRFLRSCTTGGLSSMELVNRNPGSREEWTTVVLLWS